MPQPQPAPPAQYQQPQHQQPHYQQAQYQQAPYQQAPYQQAPYQQAQHQAPTELACRMCGSVPAAAVKFRGHQGFVIVMRFLSLDGPFCRDCGLATFRSMTSRTLVQGWYGYASLIITPITVLINLVRRDTVASLPAPRPNQYAPSRPPMDAGKHLMARPMTWIGLAIPLAIAVFIGIAVASS
jgi:hypothetical protein